MNVELHSEQGEVISCGELANETVESLHEGDILDLQDESFRVKGTFAFIRKKFLVYHGRKYLPTVVLYVRSC